MAKGKLLILAWGVYPSTGGSTIIVNNISEAFSSDQLVIAGQKPASLPTKRWETFSEIKLYYLDPFILGIRKKPKLLRWLKVATMIRQVEKIVKKEKVNRILAIFPDEYYSYIAHAVSRRMGIPYDLWFHNSYLENRSGILKKLAEKLQPTFFKTASRLFVMSDGLNREMKKIYPAIDFKTLVHGFKIPQQKEETDTRIKNKEKITFLYSGSLNHSCMDASLRMMKVIKANPSFELHIFAGNPGAFEQHGIQGENVVFHKFLPIEEFVLGLKKFDIMLLPHGIDGLRSDFEFKTIFPTRTIPLLFSGKPILAHSPKGSFLTEFLEENKCASLVTDKSEQKLREAIDLLINNNEVRDAYVINAQKTASQFKLEQVAQKILDF